MLGHHGVVLAAATENAAVDLGMQGLDPTIHDLREASMLGHLGDGDAFFLEQAEGAAGGEQFDAVGDEALGKLDDACLVGDADQGAAYRQR